MTVPPTIADVPSRFLRPLKRDVELGTSVWLVPLKMSLRALGLAVVMLWLDNVLQRHYRRVPQVFRMSAGDSKTILSTLTGASITVVALVVSLMMVVLTLVASNFGPRITVNFVRRRATQMVLGSFLAVFVFSLVTLSTIFTNAQNAFVPLLSTWTAVLLALGATGLLVAFVQDVSGSIQVGNTLFDIATELAGAIQRQRELARRAHASTTMQVDTTGWEVIAGRSSGYVQRIDFDALIAVAGRAEIVVSVHHRAGAFVNAGRPLFSISGPLAAADLEATHRAITIGTYRTMEQDLEYAIAEYVEIALRALSPAVNDPATAISCIDWIGDALIALSVEPISVAAFADSSGELRVVLPANSLRRVVAAGFNEIRQAAVTAPAVSIRLLDATRRVAPVVTDAAAREELRSQAVAIAAAATAAAGAQRDRDDVQHAHRSAMHALDVDPV